MTHVGARSAGSSRISTVGAVLGAVAVAAAAFGAHGLNDRVSAEALGWWRTAAEHHLLHAVLLVVVGALAERRPSRAARVAAALLVLGIALFSGSLYALALTGARWLGALTPFGGALLIAGWISLAVAARPSRDPVA